MKQRIVNDTFWTDPYIEDLDPSEKLVFLYLLTNPLCNIAGAYEIKIKRIAYETWFDKDMVDKILKRFENDNKILRANEWIIIINFAKNQSNNPNVLKWMQRIIDSIPMPIVKALKGFERLPYFTLLNLTIPNFTSPNLSEDLLKPDKKKKKKLEEEEKEVIKNIDISLITDKNEETIEKLYTIVMSDMVKQSFDNKSFIHLYEQIIKTAKKPENDLIVYRGNNPNPNLYNFYKLLDAMINRIEKNQDTKIIKNVVQTFNSFVERRNTWFNNNK